jgi:tRNA(fMet)-specific endonuclease VapC
MVILRNELINPIILVDTDIFSYWLKKDTRGEAFRPYIIGRQMALSFATVGELLFWAYKKGWGANRLKILERVISEYLVLPYDYEICKNFARARLQQEINGEPVGFTDYWIAACALKYNIPILTNNYRHFSRIKSIKLLGPYTN